MIKNQEIKMELLKEFYCAEGGMAFIRDAYKFIIEDDPKPESANTQSGVTTHVYQDGIYLLDGKRATLFVGEETECIGDCIGVAIVQGSKSLVVSLKDAFDGDTILTTKKDPDNCKGNYIDNCDDAVADWNGKANTDHLKSVGLAADIELKDGEYIPSMGEMLFIFAHKKELNQALAFVGGQPIKNDWYWTSTETSATTAWHLSLLSGTMYGSTKASGQGRVRAVSAFIS